MQVKLTAVKRTERVSKKTGRPFVSLAIKTDQHADKWLGGFGNSDNKDWKEGDTVQIDVAQAGEYLNFTTPKKEPNGESAEVKNYLVFKVMPMLQEILDRLPAPKNAYPQPEDIGINLEDSPF